MNLGVRIVIYVVLLTVFVTCGQRFLRAYNQRMDQAAHRFDAAEGTTNLVDAVTLEPTNSAGTNLPAVAVTGTNRGSTNAPVIKASNPKPAQAAPPAPGLGWAAAGALLSVIAIALLAAQDFAHYMSVKAHKGLYNEEADGVAEPEYEAAEQVWANGNHLEAVRLMREYLQKNPRQVHVAIRIAEIYERDLNNPLAAALEYEEILEQRLESDRWGWSAIHLCNLYNRLGKSERIEPLLERIVREHDGTPAAKKARERLGLAEDATLPTPGLAQEPPPEDTNPGNLPPGFKPKKG
jgi:hypothetical protein